MPTTKEKAVAAATSVAKVLATHAQKEDAAAEKREADKAKAPADGTLVRATAMGFYGSRRRKPGEVFPLVKGRHFHKSWMELAPGAAPSPAPHTRTDPPDALTGEATGSLDVI